MANRKDIQKLVRNLVIYLRKENKSYAKMAKLVRLSRSTVQTIIKNFENNNSTENKPISAIPKNFSRCDVCSVLNEGHQDPKLSALTLKEHIST